MRDSDGKRLSPLLRDTMYRRLCEIHGPYCWYCGRELDSLTSYERKNEFWSDPDHACIDHIVPISKGGSNDISNLALACAGCNRAKLSASPAEFLTWLSGIRSSNFTCLILGHLSKGEISEIKDPDWDRLQKSFYDET